MGKGWLWHLAAVCAALTLYLFENGTGTRLLLAVLCVHTLYMWLLSRRVLDKTLKPTAVPPVGETAYSTQRPGNDPSETFQIREYVPGDPIRQIHWKLSEKTGRTLIREFSLPISGDPPQPETFTPEEEPPEEEAFAYRLWRGLVAALFYAAVWGGLCGMAGLSTMGVLPLAAGEALLLLSALLPNRKRAGLALLLGMAAALLVCVFWFPHVIDGGKLLLNRLFVASEAKQAYLYERLSVSAPEGAWMNCIRTALAVLGVLFGALLGWSARRSWRFPFLALLLALCSLGAYLGLAPSLFWCVLLAAGVSLLLLPDEPHTPWLWGVAALGLLGVVCAVVLLAFPGEDARLSAWEETIRDRAALHTTAYTESLPPAPEETPEIQNAEEQTRREQSVADLGGEDFTWIRPMSAALVIALLALALFLPVFFSDWQKKRRVKHRRGLNDPDNAAAIRAIFLYALRWLRAAGLPDRNVPFGAYGEQVEELTSPELRSRYEEVLPLWREAAYSDHAMTDSQRAEMADFLAETERTVWSGLGKAGRFKTRYLDAL